MSVTHPTHWGQWVWLVLATYSVTAVGLAHWLVGKNTVPHPPHWGQWVWFMSVTHPTLWCLWMWFMSVTHPTLWCLWVWFMSVTHPTLWCLWVWFMSVTHPTYWGQWMWLMLVTYSVTAIGLAHWLVGKNTVPLSMTLRSLGVVYVSEPFTTLRLVGVAHVSVWLIDYHWTEAPGSPSTTWRSVGVVCVSDWLIDCCWTDALSGWWNPVPHPSHGLMHWQVGKTQFPNHHTEVSRCGLCDGLTHSLTHWLVGKTWFPIHHTAASECSLCEWLTHWLLLDWHTDWLAKPGSPSTTQRPVGVASLHQ